MGPGSAPGNVARHVEADIQMKMAFAASRKISVVKEMQHAPFDVVRHLSELNRQVNANMRRRPLSAGHAHGIENAQRRTKLHSYSRSSRRKNVKVNRHTRKRNKVLSEARFEILRLRAGVEPHVDDSNVRMEGGRSEAEKCLRRLKANLKKFEVPAMRDVTLHSKTQTLIPRP